MVAHQQIQTPGLLYQNTNPSLLPSDAVAFATLQRVLSFLRRRRKKLNSHRVSSSPYFSPSQNSSAVSYSGSSEQTSRKTPDAGATVFSRSDTLRSAIVNVRKICVNGSSYILLFEKTFLFNHQPVTQFSRDQFFEHLMVASTILGVLYL